MGDPAEGKAGPKIDPMGRVPTRLAARPLSLLLGPWGSVWRQDRARAMGQSGPV